VRRATVKLFKGAYTAAWLTGGVLASPYLAYRLATTPKYRKGLKERLGIALPPEPKERPIWCHAVSVGEVLAVSELLKAVKEQWPRVPLYLSTVTATGQETACNRLGDVADAIFYLPFDLPPILSSFVGRVNPRLFLVVETELWPGLITELGERKIPQILVNGRISPNSFRNYHAFRWLMSPLLQRFHRLCMQSRRDAARMVAIGAPEERVLFTGNLKYDTIIASLSNVDPQKVREELGIPAKAKVVVAGSTHPGEEETMLNLLEHCEEELILILAPRHPERWDEVAALLEKKGIRFVRRSSGQPAGNSRVLLLDTLGELLRTYSVAEVAFVGGSLAEKGGHNPLEPAAFAVPVVMGSHIFNFKEVSLLLTEAGGMVVTHEAEETIETICRLLREREMAKSMGERGKDAVFQNRGAQQKTLKIVKEVLETT
jgi:3-deoxy-D-manno-octulosonic-acid transferase